MKSKTHFWTSIGKSIIRIGAAAIIIKSSPDYALKFFAVFFIGAELLGILEELFDERG